MPNKIYNENFNQNSSFSLKKMYFKMSSAKRRPFCLGPNVFMDGWMDGWMDGSMYAGERLTPLMDVGFATQNQRYIYTWRSTCLIIVWRWYITAAVIGHCSRPIEFDNIDNLDYRSARKVHKSYVFNTPRHGQKMADIIQTPFKCIVLKQNLWFFNKILLKGVPYREEVSTGSDYSMAPQRW